MKTNLLLFVFGLACIAGSYYSAATAPPLAVESLGPSCYCPSASR